MSNLPRYPEASAEQERKRLQEEPRDSFWVWVRYSWIKLTIVGVLGSLWLTGLIAFMCMAPNPWTAFGIYLLVSFAPVGMGLRGAGFGHSWWRSNSDD